MNLRLDELTFSQVESDSRFPGFPTLVRFIQADLNTIISSRVYFWLAQLQAELNKFGLNSFHAQVCFTYMDVNKRNSEIKLLAGSQLIDHGCIIRAGYRTHWSALVA